MKFDKIGDMVNHWAWNCDTAEASEMMAEHQHEHNWTTDMVAAEMARQKYPLGQIMKVCLPEMFGVMHEWFEEVERERLAGLNANK